MHTFEKHFRVPKVTVHLVHDMAAMGFGYMLCSLDHVSPKMYSHMVTAGLSQAWICQMANLLWAT